MANFELFDSTEYRSVGEYKNFKAEQYLSPDEFFKKPLENAFTGPESKFLEPVSTRESNDKTSNQNTDKKQSKHKVKKLFDQINNSISKITGTIGGTVAAAATAVVICTSVLLPSPKVELNHIQAGADYVTYNMTIEDLAEELDYDIIIENSLDKFVVEEVNEGENSNTIDGLRPFYKYTLKLVSDEPGEQITHYSRDFYTLRENSVNFEYGANLDAITQKDVLVEWTDTQNNISLTVPFNNDTDKTFGYRVTITDQNNNVVHQEVSDQTTLNLSLSPNVEVANCSFEEVYIDQNFVYSYGEKFNYPVYLKSSNVELLEKSLTYNNTYAIDFSLTSPIAEHEIYKSLSITVNGEEIPDYNLSYYDTGLLANRTYSFIYSPSAFVDQLDVEFNVNLISAYGGQQRSITFNKTLYNEIEFYDDVYFSSMHNQIVANFKFSAPEGTYVLLENSASDPIRLTKESSSSYVDFAGDGQVISFTLYAQDGTPLTQTKSYTFNDIQYRFYTSKYDNNPGKFLPTFNKDGTINLYIPAELETEDNGLYYDFIFKGGKEIVYTVKDQPHVILENVVYDSYSLTTQVYYYENGAKYVVSESPFSGGTFNYYFENLTFTASESSVTVVYNEASHHVFSDEFALYINDKIYRFNLSDFTQSEDGLVYELDVGEQIVSASILYSAYDVQPEHASYYDHFEVKGSLYNQFISEIPIN